MNIYKIITAILIGVSGITVNGQVIEQLSPQEKKQLTRVTEPNTIYKGFLRAGVSTLYNTFDKNFDEFGNRYAYENSISANFMVFYGLIQYGITDNIEVELNVPYASAQINGSYIVEIPYNSSIDHINYTINYGGLLDPLINLRYQIVNNKEKSFGVTLGPVIGFPLGKKDLSDFKSETDYKPPMAKGEWSLGAEVKVRKVIYPFAYEMSMMYQNFFGADKILYPNEPAVNVVSGDELLIRPAFHFHLNEWVLLTHYFDFYHASKDSFEGNDIYGSHNNEFNQYATRYYPGLSFQIKNFRLEQSIMLPITGKVMPADLAFYFRTQYVF